MADTLQALLAAGSKAALNLVKSLIDNPLLMSKDMKYHISLECETRQQTSNAEVSTSLVICRQNKTQVTDNIAPGAWTWTLSGYIPGAAAAEITNLYTPIVTTNTNIIKQWYKQGTILKFKDEDAAIYDQVVIKSLSIISQKDCRNKTPFQMTLQEINVMDDALAEATAAIASAQAAVGSILGKTIKQGSFLSQAATKAGSALAGGLKSLIR